MFRPLLVVLIVLTFAVPVCAGVPPMISYQGKLMQPSGAPVPDGIYSIQFAIYNTPTGGTALWSETNPGVQVKGGLFSVLLGSVNNLPGNIFDTPSRFFGVRVGADPEMVPRQQIASSAFAFRAAVAGTVDDGVITTGKLAELSVTGAKIAVEAVDAAKIAPNAVTGDKIAPLAISTDKLAEGSVVSTKIAPEPWQTWNVVFYKSDKTSINTATVRFARYMQIGKTVLCSIFVSGIGAPEGVWGYFSPPVAARTEPFARILGCGYIADGSYAGHVGKVGVFSGDRLRIYYESDSVSLLAGSTELNVTFVYEAE